MILKRYPKMVQFINKVDKLKHQLCRLTIQHHLSRSVVDDLLSCLREFGLNLPKCKKSLLQNKQSSLITRDVLNGQYVHFGIENALKRCNYEFLKTIETIRIDVNIDGLPLYKSSNKSLWPILGAFVDQKSVSPFVIGAWVGRGHPKSSDDFLKDLANELKILKSKKALVGRNQIQKNVILRSFICDAPAKAFVKNLKNHNAKSGCMECDQEGLIAGHTPVYQLKAGILRTDDSFLHRTDQTHHLSLDHSVLEQSGVNMVTQFPLDSMHLVDLGIVKKMLIYIIEGMSKSQKSELSMQYTSFAQYTPSEFSRRPRDFSELPRWKAVEFRFFILYSGIVLLNEKLSSDQYYHFLLLHTAYRLLSNKYDCQNQFDKAQILINEFVQIFPQFYGLKHVNYNVHSLLHLPKYVERYGFIDSFTAYRFENYMQELKKSIKNPNKILEQLNNRISEKSILNDTFLSLGLNDSRQDDIFPGSTSYKGFKYNSLIFKANRRDCFCLIVHNTTEIVFKMNEITEKDLIKSVIGYRFLKITSLFTEPVDSKDALGIIVADELSPQLETFSFEKIIAKYCAFPKGNDIVLVPLLHEHEH